MTRYAVYGIPGIDPAAPRVAARLRARVDAWYAEHPAITADPRRYGFHCTLKAPFRLADGVAESDLDDAVSSLAASRPPVVLEAVRPAAIGRFRALIATGDETASDALAAVVVEELDPLRAPLTEAETARRRPDRLSPRQRELLARYGYPYVFDEFRLHMTLTDSIGEASGVRVLEGGGQRAAGLTPESGERAIDAAISAHFADVAGRDIALTALAVCVEREPGAPFAVRSVHALGAAGAADPSDPTTESEGAIA